MNKKSVISVLLAVVLCMGMTICLISCENDENEKEPSSSRQEQTSELVTNSFTGPNPNGGDVTEAVTAGFSKNY